MRHTLTASPELLPATTDYRNIRARHCEENLYLRHSAFFSSVGASTLQLPYGCTEGGFCFDNWLVRSSSTHCRCSCCSSFIPMVLLCNVQSVLNISCLFSSNRLFEDRLWQIALSRLSGQCVEQSEIICMTNDNVEVYIFAYSLNNL